MSIIVSHPRPILYPQMLRNLLNTVLNLLLPHRCFGCRRSGTVLCERCASMRESADPLDAPDTYALFAYRDPVVQKMIWALKYRGVQAVGEQLGARLYDYLAEDLADATLLGGGDQNWLVIPIPLAPARERTRGFNQATAIARGLVQRGGGNFILAENILRRARDTGSQTEIRKRAKRLANMRNAFAVVNPEVARGKQIIIIDDVITTGGTMMEAWRALARAGAKIVISAAVAHG
ncbi:MAG: phosphoribosyltransferase family protein [Candidatus Vogelbacteria bacterium]